MSTVDETIQTEANRSHQISSLRHRFRASKLTSGVDIDVPRWGDSESAFAQIAHAEKLQLLKNRLMKLNSANFQESNEELDKGSVAALECVMHFHPDFRLPLLGAESTHKIVATWKSGRNYLSLRFTDRYSFDYALTHVEDSAPRRSWGRGKIADFFTNVPEARRITTE